MALDVDALTRFLKQKEGAAVEGRVIAPRVDRITIAQLAEDLKTEYRANGRRSLDRVTDAIGHLLPVFGPRSAVKVSSADVRAYQAKRQAEGAANATINRECAALKRMYSLAIKGEKIHRGPHIGMTTPAPVTLRIISMRRCAIASPSTRSRL